MLTLSNTVLEREHQCTNSEEEYPTRKEIDEKNEINTLRQSQHERQMEESN
jgi:hypothetical protein